MKAMIFAAGLGTRLKPLTDTMPKALVPVGGKPLLGILLDKLQAAGATDVVINIHHFADQIRDYIRLNEHHGMDIHFSDESEKLLETGGGIKYAMPYFANDDEPFLVHNVDILSNVDIKAFYQQCRGNAATLLVSNRDTQRYLLFDHTNRLVGWTNLKTGEVRSPYPHLDVSSCRRYAFAGIHLFSPRLFRYFGKWPDCFSIIDFYLSVCADEPIYGCFSPDLQLMDVGKLESLAAADVFLHTLMP